MTVEEIQAEIERRGVHPQVGPYGEGHDIQQNSWEFARFAAAMQELGVQTVLEIGTGPHAGLARFMHEYLHWNVTSVDKYGCWVKWDGIEFIVSDERIDFGDRRFDLLIIDGNHAYDFVKGDHEYYGKYATKAIMFHDICGLRGCEGVKRYWDEISAAPLFNEVIAPDEQRVGIGWYEVEVAKERSINGFINAFEEIGLEVERTAPNRIEVTITDSGGKQSKETVIVDKPKRKPAAKKHTTAKKAKPQP